VERAKPSLRIGDISIWAVMDGRFTFAEPPGFVACGNDHLPGDGTWLMDVGGFVVQAGDRLVLVDAGAGQGDVYKAPPFHGLEDAPAGLRDYVRGLGITDPRAVDAVLRSMAVTEIRTGSFGENLSRLGFAREDVTDVLLSHLHFDHIAWVSKDGAPYFPNAVVRCERNDVEHFLAPDYDDSLYRDMWGAMPTAECMAPVLDRLETWDEDAVLAPGVEAGFAPGHTPGSAVFVISSGREQAVILGDTVHCPAEVVDPSVQMGFDVDPVAADRARERIRHDFSDGRTLVGSPHFPDLLFGRIVPGDRGATWQLA
jgi:glyoxylase-like metal-dependent hydrolase (beta-lactamase superfamily II)